LRYSFSQNQIREIVIDSDNDEEKYYPSDMEDEEEPRPLSRQSSISQPPSIDFSTSSSEVEDEVGIVASQQPQPSQWTMPLEPRRRVVHTFTGAHNGKRSEGGHITRETTPICVMLLFFAKIILLAVETNRYYHQFLDNSDGPFLQSEVTSGSVYVEGR
jgi:hypothetical protein